VAFTSDLSVAEFVLAAEAGLRPLRLVGGAGLFRLPPPGQGGESDYTLPSGTVSLTDQADLWHHAIATVLGRLWQEARECGAELVTGVSLRRRVPVRRPCPDEPADWYREFTATGTAMIPRGRSAWSSGPVGTPGTAGTAGTWPAGTGPVLTNLRMPDYWKLTAQGCAPAGLVAATGVAAGRSARLPSSSPVPHPGNRDRPELHDITRLAYSTALKKLRADAARLSSGTAAGVSAIEIERQRTQWFPSEFVEQTAVFVHAIGTALSGRPSGDGGPAPLTITPVRHLGS
jgi:hypothetical protein